MKNLCLCLLVTVILSFHAIADIKFEPVPVNIDYKGAVTRNDTIIAYGTCGSLHVSFDNGGQWEQRSIFKKGNIEAMFWEDNRIIAFNDFGDVAISKNNTKTWTMEHKFNDSILSVLKCSEGYLIRSITRIFTVSQDFHILKESPLYTKPGNYTYKPLYHRNSTAVFKDNFIVEAEGANFICYSKDLSLIDTVSFRELGLCSTCKSGYQVRTDSTYLYVVVDNKIFRTDDLIQWDSIFLCKGNSNLFKTVNGQNIIIEIKYHTENKWEPFTMNAYNIIGKDSSIKLAEYESEFIVFPLISDMIYVNGIFYIFGGYNSILSVNIKDSVMKVLSDFESSTVNVLSKTGDSSYVIKSGKDLIFTNNNGVILKPLINYHDNIQYSNLSTINFFYFDDEKKTLYMAGAAGSGGKEGVYITDNYGQSFKYCSIPEYYFNFLFPHGGKVDKIAFLPLPIQKTANGFVTSCFTQYSNTVFTKILTFDKDFNTIAYFLDINYPIDFVDSKDTNTFLVHCLNVNDNSYEIKYSSDKGKNWEMIKKYNKADSMFFFRELKINCNRALAMFYYNPTDSIYFIDVLDVESRTVNEIYKYKILQPNLFTKIINGICTENDTIYLAIEDTIFYTTDIYDRSKWNYYLLPDNGRILFTMQKFGDRFWAGYMDTNYVRYVAYSENNLFWLKMVNDTTVSVVEKPENTEETYLYTYPPKPLPARSTVRSLIYFDPRVEFDLDKVGVVDVSGAKIDSKQDITLDRLTPYSGYLTWNCSAVNSGVYFIHIRHGNNARVVKVIVSK